jgi:hypothetical protein
VAEEIAPIRYPDERYSKVVLWWDRATIAHLAAQGQVATAMSEWKDLSHGWGGVGAAPALEDKGTGEGHYARHKAEGSLEKNSKP